MRITALSALFLVGCSSVNPAGLIALARLDPMTARPGDMTVAVGVPDALNLRDGDAVFAIAYAPQDPNAEPIDASYPLVIISGGAGPREPLAGETIYLARFAPEDAAELAAVQAQIRRDREMGGEGKGSISVGVEGGCLADRSIEALPVSIWLQTDPGASFAPLVSGADLFGELTEQEEAAFRSEIAAC